MRIPHLLVISTAFAAACLENSGVAPFPCQDSTGLAIGPECVPPPPEISLEGPAFMLARIDTSEFSLDENDVLEWFFDGRSLLILGEPGRTSAAAWPYIDIQVTHDLVPGDYALNVPGGVGAGFYGVFAGSPPVPVSSYQTLGDEYWGTLHISAIDTTLGVIAGKFEFLAVRNDGGTDFIRVTNGSFRIRERLR